jgi:hypothetical protein
VVITEDGLPSPEMTVSEIMQAGLAHIDHEVRSMADHHIMMFLRSGEPSDTIADQRTFSAIEDVQAQILKSQTQQVGRSPSLV